MDSQLQIPPEQTAREEQMRGGAKEAVPSTAAQTGELEGSNMEGGMAGGGGQGRGGEVRLAGRAGRWNTPAPVWCRGATVALGVALASVMGVNWPLYGRTAAVNCVRYST